MRSTLLACVILAAFAGLVFAPPGGVGICTNISSSGSYVLTANLSGGSVSAYPGPFGMQMNSCILINASNVDLNCQGNNITWDGTNTDTRRAGIIVMDAENVSIKNCVIWNYTTAGGNPGFGIHAFNADTSNFTNNTIHSCTEGFSVYYCDDVVINDSEIYDHSWNSVYVENSDNVTVRNNTLRNSLASLTLSGTHNSIVLNNSGHSNTQNCFVFDGSNDNVFAENIVHNCGSSTSITLSGANRSVFANNTVYAGSYAFQVSNNANNNTFHNNSVENMTTYGFYVYGTSAGNNFTLNRVHNCTSAGFSVRQLGCASHVNTPNRFENNTVTKCGRGFDCFCSDSNTYVGNTVANGTTGAYMSYCDNSTFIGNTFANSSTGIYSTYSGSSVYEWNIIANNSGNGIYMDQNSPNANNFSHNDIFNTSVYGIYLTTGGMANIVNNTVHTAPQTAVYVSASDCGFYNNTIYDFAKGISLQPSAQNNNLVNNTIHGVGGGGIGLEVLVTGTPNHWINDTFIYNVTNTSSAAHFVYTSAASSSVRFRNLTLGYNETSGLVNWVNADTGSSALRSNAGTSARNIILDPYFVSVHAGAAYMGPLNSPANVTIETENCSSTLYMKTGFPASREAIQSGSIYTPGYDTCTSGVRTFNVSGFSGYTTYVPPANNCTSITAPGTTTLTGDLEGAQPNGVCISILSDDVILDCAGYSITGNWVPDATAIWIDAADNVTITGCDISNYSIGVSSTEGHPSLNTVSIGQSSNINITGNDIHDLSDASGSAGVYMENVSGVAITGNTIYNTGEGVIVGNATGMEISGNTFDNIGSVALVFGHNDAILLLGDTPNYGYEANTFSTCIPGKCNALRQKGDAFNLVVRDTSFGSNWGVRIDGGTTSTIENVTFGYMFMAYNYASSNFEDLDASGNTSNYFLFSELSDCLIDNLTLNDAGGFYAEEIDFTTISNVRGVSAVSETSNYFMITGAYNSIVEDISFENFNFIGFYSGSSDNYNTTFRRINATNFSGWGLDFYNADTCVLEDVILDGGVGGAYGFYAQAFEDSTAMRVNITNIDGVGAYFGDLEDAVFQDFIIDGTGGYGVYISGGGFTSNFSNFEIYDTDDYAFYDYGTQYNNYNEFAIDTSSSYGVYLEQAYDNNYTNFYVSNTDDYGLYVYKDSEGSVFRNLSIYDTDNYIYYDTTTDIGYEWLTLGFNATVGLINYPASFTMDRADVVNGTNIALSPYFVSLNASDSGTAQLNRSANITIMTENCTWAILELDGFQTTRAEIQADGSVYLPAYEVCAADINTFSVENFSGYTFNNTPPKPTPTPTPTPTPWPTPTPGGGGGGGWYPTPTPTPTPSATPLQTPTPAVSPTGTVTPQPGAPTATQEDALDALSDAENAIEQAKYAGKDVGAAEELLRQATDAYEQGDYDRAKELARSAADSANQASPGGSPAWTPQPGVTAKPLPSAQPTATPAPADNTWLYLLGGAIVVIILVGGAILLGGGTLLLKGRGRRR